MSVAGQKRHAVSAENIPPDLDAYVNRVLSTFEVPGISVSIVQNGRVLLTKGYGVRKTGDTARVDAHTLFLIASNSKAFTATALAILVEEGKLGWDDPVIDHLPWFRMYDPYVTTHMTIRDLLVHHSGIPAYAGDLLIFPPSSYSRKEIVSKLAKIQPVNGFRTTYAYDNILYLAAGEVIKAVSGMEWEDFIRTKIFDRLDMQESICRFSMLKSQLNVAMGHARIDGVVKPLEYYQDQDIGDAGDPAGGVCTNAYDMSKWLITQLDSGMSPNKTRIFKPAATGQLWKVVTPMPVDKMPDELKPAQMDFRGYALGFRAFNYGSDKVICHGGMLSGFVSQIALIPRLGLGISVFTNQESTGAYWSIIYHVLDYYLHKPSFDWIGGYKKQLDTALAEEKKARAEKKIDPDPQARLSLPIEKYAGRYRHGLYGDVTVTKEPSGLVLRFTKCPQLVADLDYFQFDTFLARYRHRSDQSNAYVSFSTSPKGEVDLMRIKGVDEDDELSVEGLLLTRVRNPPAGIDTAGLRDEIMAELGKHPEGVFAVAYKDIASGQQFLINEHDNFHAASTMKTPVMIETFRQAAMHKFSLGDSIVIHTNFKSIVDSSTYTLDSAVDSETDLYRRAGTKMTIRDLLYRMITKSSNLATNMIIEIVGARNVTAAMRSLGADDIRVLRGVEDQAAFKKGMNNTTTAYDLMLIMEHIARKDVVSEAACDEMIRIMLDQYFTGVIKGKLPPDVKVASKSGSIDGIHHDSGIVFLPDGRKYVVVLLSRGIASQEASIETLANVSKIIYDHVENN